ncbi:MAG TPA: gas vesicle protein GvpO [Acidimicrobiales bacterium]|nr:gas vesicle protein GvpO [Acidimicrobiales bacterium]
MSGNGAAPLRTIIARVVAQLQELTGRPGGGVTAARRDADGWHLTVEVVELERVPASTSIVGAYDVLADEQGNLIEYARTGRYHRNQTADDT